MRRVIVIDGRAERAGALRDRLADARWDVAVAPSGSFALTLLERHRADAIVSRHELPDLPGDELCAIVRSDPVTKTIPFVLVTDMPRSVALLTSRGGADLLLAGRFDAATLATRIEEFLSTLLGDPAETPAPSLGGSLGAMDLVEVLQTLAAAGKTGRLAIVLPSGHGELVVEGGRVIHATFAGLTGEPAVEALVDAAGPAGRFTFTPLAPRAISSEPRTIHVPVAQLLLSVAARLDEGRARREETPRVEERV